jgi:CRP-like cAMP-binding protein
LRDDFRVERLPGMKRAIRHGAAFAIGPSIITRDCTLALSFDKEPKLSTRVGTNQFGKAQEMAPSDVLLRKLKYHSPIDSADVAAVRRLRYNIRELAPGEEFISQGDRPKAAAIVIEGIMARYHTLRSGSRQYLALHYPGDWPDAQGLFLQQMDHSVCAMGRALVCSVSHEQLMKVFAERPTIGLSVWRETLIDAAIFRESITNNCGRHGTARIAHFFCEQFYRAKFAGLVEDNACPLPLTQAQLGEMLGMSLVSTNRYLQALRQTKAADHRAGKLFIRSWPKLASLGEFDPKYLHQIVRQSASQRSPEGLGNVGTKSFARDAAS